MITWTNPCDGRAQFSTYTTKHWAEIGLGVYARQFPEKTYTLSKVVRVVKATKKPDPTYTIVAQDAFYKVYSTGGAFGGEGGSGRSVKTKPGA